MIHYKYGINGCIMDESKYKQGLNLMLSQVLPLIRWNKMESV